jgi:hypothetical protein
MLRDEVKEVERMIEAALAGLRKELDEKLAKIAAKTAEKPAKKAEK